MTDLRDRHPGSNGARERNLLAKERKYHFWDTLIRVLIVPGLLFFPQETTRFCGKPAGFHGSASHFYAGAGVHGIGRVTAAEAGRDQNMSEQDQGNNPVPY